MDSDAASGIAQDGGNPPGPQAPSRPTVVIADDAHDSRQLLGKFLRHFTRAAVIEARSGTQAVSAFRTHAPALVFLDLDMPEMDGLAALKEIRAIDERAFVVIVSGVSSPANVSQALQLGAGAFVVKPFSESRILEVLKRCEARIGEGLLVPQSK